MTDSTNYAEIILAGRNEAVLLVLRDSNFMMPWIKEKNKKNYGFYMIVFGCDSRTKF